MHIIKELVLFPVSLISAAGRILSDRKLLLLTAIPLLIGIGTYILSISLFYAYKEEIVHFFVHTSRAWLQQLLSWAFFLVALFLSGIIALISATSIGGFFLELFSEEVLKRNNLPVPSHQGVRANLSAALASVLESSKRAVFLLFCGVLLFGVSIIPLCAIPAFILGAFLLGTNIIDIPLSVQGLQFRDRWKICRTHKWWCLMIGATMSVATTIPFVSIVLIPVLLLMSIEKMREWNT